MDGARLTRFPHLSWLGYRFESPAGSGTHCWNLNGHAHALHMTFRGPHRVRWISRGHETNYAMQAGSFHFLPADDESHTIVANAVEPLRSYTVFLPRNHLTAVATSDHVADRFEFHRLLIHDDPVLQVCMTRLARRAMEEGGADECMKDEAARRLVLRLIEISGGDSPDWHADASTFSQKTMVHLVEYIDAHLHIAPSPYDIALLAGLSPSHFAKKFRQTTGLSLHRFINRRRVKKSLDMLRDSTDTLAGVALQLGFSSQSHFTRMFSAVTCMTPAKYRKQFKRTVG